MAGDITRPLGDDAKKYGLVEIDGKGNTDVLNNFSTKLAKVFTKMTTEYRPFDRYGARVDFEHHIKQYVADVNSTLDASTVKAIEAFDLMKYGRPELFELIDSKLVTEEKIAGNMNTRVPVITGKKYEWKCKTRGNLVTMFVPSEDVEKVEKMVTAEYKKAVIS
jgi:hypothetical protein